MIGGDNEGIMSYSNRIGLILDNYQVSCCFGYDEIEF